MFNKFNQSASKWFSTVKILRVYEIYDMKDKSTLQEFINNFTDLESLRTLVTEQFNPFAKIIETKKALPQLQTTYVTDEASKAVLKELVETCPIKYLALAGGDLNNVNLDIQPPAESLQAIRLKDMPSVDLTHFFDHMKVYNFTEFSLIRIESIDKAKFAEKVKPVLMDVQALKKFRYEINHENFTNTFDDVVDIVNKHTESLEHLSFGKTPVSTDNIKALVARLSSNEKVALKTLDLTHIFNNQNFSFEESLKELQALSRPGKILTVLCSRYQVKCPKELQEFVLSNNINVCIIFDSKETVKKPL